MLIKLQLKNILYRACKFKTEDNFARNVEFERKSYHPTDLKKNSKL